MLGRDSRTLSKFFEKVVQSPVEYDQILFKAKEVVVSPQRKYIEGLKY